MRLTCSRMECMRMPAMRIKYLLRLPVRSRCLLLLLLASCFLARNCRAQNASGSGCTNSTVADAWGPEFASQAKTFFIKVQQIVRDDNKKAFATLAHYPLHVYGPRGATEISNPTELLHQYSRLITPDARRAIIAQSADCLFGNGQGVMAAGGRLWFQKQNDGRFELVTLNIVRTK